MDQTTLIEKSEKTLERTLSFFSRVESRGSVLFAINTAMLATLAGNAPASKAFSMWYMWIVIIPLILISVSFVHLYQSAFPSLSGGQSSLIYFREICNRTESKFMSEFKSQSQEEYLNDLISQVWRNSEILKKKFDSLKSAFIFLALAILPWVVTLFIFINQNNLKESLLKNGN